MTIKQSEKYIETKKNELQPLKRELKELLIKRKKKEDLLKNNKIDKKLSKKEVKDIKSSLVKLLMKEKQLNKDIKSIDKLISKENKNLSKKLKPKAELDFVWKISTGIFGVGFLLLLIISLVFKTGSSVWMGATFLCLMMFLGVFMFLVFLAKKTHAILEFKSMMSGKPLCLFFTDHKRVDWKVIEPEAGIITDKKYGSFLINQKGTYIDEKTKSLLIPFNPALGTNASVEVFKMTDSLSKLFKDEKKIADIRYALAEGSFVGDKVTINNDGVEEEIQGLETLRESIDFSHLKSFSNTLQPHNISSKVEMMVAQRMGGKNAINTAQIILIIVAIIGATALAAMLLKTMGGSGGSTTTTIIKEVATQAATNMTASNTLGG